MTTKQIKQRMAELGVKYDRDSFYLGDDPDGTGQRACDQILIEMGRLNAELLQRRVFYLEKKLAKLKTQ